MASPLQRHLYWSFSLHIGVFLLILISPFFPKTSSFRHEKIVWVSLPKGGSNQFGHTIKKSEGLPKTTIQEQKKALESPPKGQKKSEMTYTVPKTRLGKETQKKGEADSRIEEALSRVQRQIAMKKMVPEAAQIPQAQPGGFVYGSPKGPYLSPEDPEYVLYQTKIRQRIMNEWILPLKYAEGDFGLICRIIVHMNERGEVVQTEWDKKSGNPSFDLSAMRAIEKASPLDIPPERLKYEVIQEGFIVEFNPRAAQKASP